MSKWLEQPEDHDYPAAESYLSLFLPEIEAKHIVVSLREAPVIGFKAKDIFRASRLPLLGLGNSHIEKNLRKIKNNIKLSPILLVRADHRVIIADGYHRLCAVYAQDEDALIPCKIVTARELTKR